MFLWLGQWLRLNEGFAHLKVISDSSVNTKWKRSFFEAMPMQMFLFCNRCAQFGID